MKLKHTTIKIDTHSITPTLTICPELEYKHQIEAPVSISGKLCSSEGKTIALLNEYQVSNENSYGIKILTPEQKEKFGREKNVGTYYAELTASLTHSAIEYIENQRDKNSEKAVSFQLSFVVKYVVMEAEPSGIEKNDFIRLEVQTMRDNLVIKQSEWIRDYAPKLGVGNFLLLELKIPDGKKATGFWKEYYERLAKNLEQIETCLRSGDWEKGMIDARRFYENAKFGQKKTDIENRAKFSELMTEYRHSEAGVDNIYTVLFNLFNFTSKYLHDRDTDANPQAAPICKKEDLYFVYATAVGFLNFVGCKISEE